MAKTFFVDIDITMSKRLEVQAADENEARSISLGRVINEPYYHAGSADAFVTADVFDVDEDKDGKEDDNESV